MPENEDQSWEEDLYEDYVPVAYGRDDDQAAQLVDILNDHEIPAEIGESAEIPTEQGVPVLVPADLVGEATEIIEDYEGLEGLVLADDEFDDEDEDEEEEGFEEVEEEDLFLGDGEEDEEEEEEGEEEEEEPKEKASDGDDDDDDEFEFEDEDE